MHTGAAFVYRRICGKASDGVQDAAGAREQVEREVALEGDRRLLYYLVAEKVGRQIPDLTVITRDDLLLEDIRIRPGKMFGTLK